MQIQNNVAIVTGGASGLGAETAKHLANLGAKVAILDLNIEAGQKLADELGGIFITTNIGDEKNVSDALTQIVNQLGAPRILVNCAGIGGGERVVGREAAMPLENFAKIINVNLIGTFNMIRLTATLMATLEPLEDNERGTIINTASVAVQDGQIGQAAYAASKGGIVSMTLPIAREVARFGIRLNTVAPGIFLTPLLDELPIEAQEALAANIPFPKRLGKPSEFAALVETCITNTYLNAETIRIDGGVRLAPK
ncbi:MAG: SDR family NAD(P)-dependent oxidoreductase [Alphaproteobacteria bacterium]|nr:SDR family NAD(P)-dependent oxidoreductase [Alphaproteobacteria bacterium]